MKSYLLIAASALALAACQAKTPQRVALDCPSTEGKLTRVGQAADGKSCAYRGADGAEIELSLMAIPGGIDATLKTVEEGLLPAPSEADQVRAQAAADAAPTDGDEDIQIDIPGLKVVASDNRAAIKVGDIDIDANDGRASIRKREEVRLKGEALSREKRGVRASYLRAGDDLPGGYRYVGYQVAGPKTGPLAVAVVRSKSDDGDTDAHVVGLGDADIKRLVRRNGGV